MSDLYDKYGPEGEERGGIPVGTVLDCGDPVPEREGIGTGYAGDPAAREMICYRHAEEREAADFAKADVFSAYHTGAGKVRDWQAPHGVITTWTGRKLATVTAEWSTPAGGYNRYGQTMRHIQAVAADGTRWHGKYMPDWSELVTLRRNK